MKTPKEEWELNKGLTVYEAFEPRQIVDV